MAFKFDSSDFPALSGQATSRRVTPRPPKTNQQQYFGQKQAQQYLEQHRKEFELEMEEQQLELELEEQLELAARNAKINQKKIRSDLENEQRENFESIKLSIRHGWVSAILCDLQTYSFTQEQLNTAVELIKQVQIKYPHQVPFLQKYIENKNFSKKASRKTLHLFNQYCVDNNCW